MPNEGDSKETERLLEQTHKGDRSALNDLFALHRAYLRRLIDLRMEDDLRGRVDPSDVIQETQLEASRRIQGYLASRAVPFRIWLRRTAIEQMVNLRRQHVIAQKRTVRREVQLPDHSSIALAQKLLQGRPSEILQRRELVQQVQGAIAEMDLIDREVLLLRHIEELTNKEVAALLDLDASTASQRYGRALIRFREKLIDMGILHGRKA